MTSDPAQDPFAAFTPRSDVAVTGGRPGPLANADRPRTAVAVQGGSAVVIGAALALVLQVQQVVLGLGGSCGSGGPYVTRVECPGGVGWVGLAIPLMIVATMLGTATASGSSTPLPVFPMWAVLFGGLGIGFLGTGETGGIVIGAVFLLMALPAALLMLASLRRSPTDPPHARAVRVGWLVAYLALGALGALLGVGFWRLVS